MEILGSIFWLLVALGLLVTFHEFGHYWVARRAGVKVLRFSVGFGRPLWRRRASNGVEFVIAAIPLGGYVKMLDEREAAVADADLEQAFNRKSLAKRSAIVAAGPVFNLIFAVAAFWAMFMLGIPESRPVVGHPDGIAEAAGLEHGDMIVQVNDRQVQTWTHTVLALLPAALDRTPVTLVVEDEQSRRRQLRLPLDRLGSDFREDRILDALGMPPWRVDLPQIIGQVSENSPAERAGLQSGDRVVAINGRAVDGWVNLVSLIAEAVAADRPVQMEITRSGMNRNFEIMPERIDGRMIIGVMPGEPGPDVRAAMQRASTILRYGPVEGFGQAVGETWRLTSATLGILGRMITGNASLSNLSGPITIARLANDSASLGISRFLLFLGLISLSLAVINLLPIPILDGGHLLYFLIEWIKGSPVSERGLMLGQSIGLTMVFALMSVALFNDILRLVQ